MHTREWEFGESFQNSYLPGLVKQSYEETVVGQVRRSLPTPKIPMSQSLKPVTVPFYGKKKGGGDFAAAVKLRILR